MPYTSLSLRVMVWPWNWGWIEGTFYCLPFYCLSTTRWCRLYLRGHANWYRCTAETYCFDCGMAWYGLSLNYALALFLRKSGSKINCLTFSFNICKCGLYLEGQSCTTVIIGAGHPLLFHSHGMQECERSRKPRVHYWSESVRLH